MTRLLHGGDLGAFGALYPNAPRPLIDLSTGINPTPYAPRIDQQVLTRLPGKADYEICVSTFCKYASVKADYVRAIPGSQSAISTLPTLFEPGKVAILAPTYAEHDASWYRAGHQIASLDADQIQNADADIVVVTNPNNPDGQIFDRGILQRLQDRQHEKNGWLIVDEAFIDPIPTASIADSVADGGLIVLRSFGKFFGLAGLRLGFIVAPVEICDRLSNHLGPWSVSTLALQIGAEAYGDNEWIKATRRTLGSDSDRLRALLANAGLRPVGGTSLFQLVECDAAQELAAHLGAHGLFVRLFDYEPDWIRFGLAASEPEWARLEDALQTFGEAT